MTQPLIPTPITDKNGKQTTVYRSSTKGNEPSSKVFPAPTALDAEDLRSIIAYDIAAAGRHTEVAEALETMDAEMLNALSKSIRHLRKVEKTNPKLVTEYAFRALVENNDHESINIMIEHGHKASGHLSLTDTVQVVRKIKSMDYPENPYMDNLDAHLEAAGKLTCSSGSGDPDHFYYFFEPLIIFVNKHPDKVDDILAFRVHVGADTYPEEQFLEWRTHGPLRDGSL